MTADLGPAATPRPIESQEDRMTDQQTIPTLTTTSDAIALMDQLAADHDWVSVFWDRGWGDQPTKITIIVDGNGQQPKARITDAVYKQLLADRTIPENSLRTFKARRCHDYREPKPEPRTSPNPATVAAEAVGRVIDGLPDVPAFIQTGIFPNYRYRRNKAGEAAVRDQWSVRLCVGHSDVAVSGAGAVFLGEPDLIGGMATCVRYDDHDGGVTGERFAAALVEVIRAKYAEVIAAKEANG